MENARSINTQKPTETNASPTLKLINTVHVQQICRGRKSQAPPRISQPQEVGCFATDDNGITCYNSKTNLRTFKEPTVPVDLNEGFENFVEKNQEQSSTLDRVMQAITECNVNVDTVDVISFRNNFNKILETPYSRNKWTININKLKDKMYFHIVHLNEEQSNQDPDQQKLFTFYGYKFEDVCTSSSDSDASSYEPKSKRAKEDSQVEDQDEKSTIKKVNPNVEFASLVRVSIGNHKLLLGAEVDCCLPKKESVNQTESSHTGKRSSDTIDSTNQNIRTNPELSSYVELKTSKMIESSKSEHVWKRFKLLKFWIQSFLVGVPTIMCGFRDDKGIVRRIEEIKVSKIPSMAKGKWDPWDCLHFADYILSMLKKYVKEESEVPNYSLVFKEPFQEVKLYYHAKESGQ